MYKLLNNGIQHVVRIYVNGIALPYSWNKFKTKEEALREIEKNNISGCNPLTDWVEIRQEEIQFFNVEYY